MIILQSSVKILKNHIVGYIVMTIVPWIILLHIKSIINFINSCISSLEPRLLTCHQKSTFNFNKIHILIINFMYTAKKFSLVFLFLVVFLCFNSVLATFHLRFRRFIRFIIKRHMFSLFFNFSSCFCVTFKMYVLRSTFYVLRSLIWYV